MMKAFNYIRPAVVGLLFILTSCEPFYDPICNDDVPASPGSVWERKKFTVKKTTENPYDAADLSGTMPLSKLLDIALYNNPSTRASWHGARAAAYGYRASLSAYYPAISYVGSLNAQTNSGTVFATSGSGQGVVTNNVTTPAARSSTNSTFIINNINLSYLLLDFGGRDAIADIALQTLYASNWQHDYTMQQVMLSVLNAYVAYIGNKGLVEGYEMDLKDAEIAVKAAKALHDAGLATLTDELSAMSNYELIRTNLAQAQGQERTAFGEILISVGLSPDTPISVDNLPQDLPVIEISGNVSSLLDLAKKKRPDLGIAIAAIKEQEDQLALSYSNSMPIFTANANWNQIRSVSPRRPSGYNEIAFIELSAPLFQGFYFMNQQRQLRAQIEQALANLDVQVAAVSTQVITSYYALKAAESAIPSSEAAVKYATRAYRGFVLQYRTGTASITDVLTALTALSNARAQLVLIRSQWAGSLANLAFSVGVLDENSGEFRNFPSPKIQPLSRVQNDQ